MKATNDLSQTAAHCSIFFIQPSRGRGRRNIRPRYDMVLVHWPSPLEPYWRRRSLTYTAVPTVGAAMWFVSLPLEGAGAYPRPKTMLDKVRNIGIMAHVDAGKTTTTERISNT